MEMMQATQSIHTKGKRKKTCALYAVVGLLALSNLPLGTALVPSVTSTRTGAAATVAETTGSNGESATTSSSSASTGTSSSSSTRTSIANPLSEPATPASTFELDESSVGDSAVLQRVQLPAPLERELQGPGGQEPPPLEPTPCPTAMNSSSSSSSSSSDQVPTYDNGSMVYHDDKLLYVFKPTSPASPTSSPTSDDRNERYDEDEDDIDCSKFQDLDEAPAKCSKNDKNDTDENSDDQENPHADDGFDIYDPSTWIPLNLTTPENLPYIENLVTVEFSVCVPKTSQEHNMEWMSHVVAAAASKLVGYQTPFGCFYWPDGANTTSSTGRRRLAPQNLDQMHPSTQHWDLSMTSNAPVLMFPQDLLGGAEDASLSDDFGNPSLRYYNENNPATRHAKRQLPSRWLEDVPSTNVSTSTAEASSSDDDGVTVDLLYAWSWVRPIAASLAKNDSDWIWYWTRVDFGAFYRMEHLPRPISRGDHIGNVTSVCQRTMNKTIDSGVFEGILFAMADEMNQTEQGMSFLEVATVGNEEIVNEQLLSLTFRESLSLDWGYREWIGLGLFCFTSLLAWTLWVCAIYLERKAHGKNEWGAFFTEPGVSDLLQVGWRYQEEVPVRGGEGQLYLQVYNKGKVGYNDDDSMLQGGVEQETIAATTVPTSNESLTRVLGGTGSASIQSVGDDSRQMPSTASIRTPPEQECRSHQYEESQEGGR